MKKLLTICILITLLFSSCSNDDVSSEYSLNQITGFSQKGPFTIGSTVTLIELDNELNQTGKTFNTTINSGFGDFEFSNIGLVSSFALIQVNGYYFNEITGELSNSSINLRTLVDFNSKTTMNINLVTHLEVERVYYLIEQGMSFYDAKIRAKQDIFAILNLVDDEESEAENLDLTESKNLLAFSSIFQAFRTEAELTELVNRVSLDIEEDGMLSDLEIKTSLVTQATFLDADLIRSNLEQRYSDLGINIDISSINSHLENFLLNTEYIFVDPLDYPDTGWNGRQNLLNPNNNTFQGYNYDITIANVPNWSKVKVRFLDSSGNFQPFRWNGIDIGTDTYSGEGWLINDGVLESSETFNDCGCSLADYSTGTGTLKVYINEKEHWNKLLTFLE